MNFNRVMMCGNLGKDPELQKVGADEKSKVVLSVAVSRRNQKDGDKPDWFNVTVWGKQAETCAQYLTKGQLVMIEGYLKPFEYEAKDGGGKRYGLEVVADDVQFGPKAKAVVPA